MVCTKPTCLPDTVDGTRRVEYPLTQAALDELAIAQSKPVTCDHCGAELTETVDGPDPRD